MGNGIPIHGREGILHLSTSSGSTAFGTEVAYTNSFTWTPSKANAEVPTTLPFSQERRAPDLLRLTKPRSCSSCCRSALLATRHRRHLHPLSHSCENRNPLSAEWQYR